MRAVTIVGAGFSGLTLAFELQRLGLKVTVLERQKRAGGLLGTKRLPEGLAETAANALLANREVEELFNETGTVFAKQLPTRKKRYIFWESPKRWPLSKRSSAKLVWTGARLAWGRSEVFPRAGETVHEWSARVLDQETEDRLLQPALQGVFAGDTKVLSAPLTLSSMFQGKSERGQWKGSVAPLGGMEELIANLEKTLTAGGGEIQYGVDFKMPEYMTEPIVLCTSAWNAADIVKTHDPNLAQTLSACESLPLMTVTAFFAPHESDMQGFGCLFPPSQDFAASGVLFNTSIFEKRARKRSETWIFGGYKREDFLTWSDEQIAETIVKDRQRLTGRFEQPTSFDITRWPRAIPHYSVAWEKTLKNVNAKPPLFLHGNYLGVIGLSRIYSRSRALAKSIQELYG
jgi:protoporphyrinogen/coproporphyrinogen III oxidase